MKGKSCTKVNEEKTDTLYQCSCKNFYDCEFPRLRLEASNGGFNVSLNSSQYIKYDYNTLKCIVLLEPDRFNADGGAWRLG